MHIQGGKYTYGGRIDYGFIWQALPMSYNLMPVVMALFCQAVNGR